MGTGPQRRAPASAVRPLGVAVRRMVAAQGRLYPRTMTPSTQDQAPADEAELSETEAAEIEERLRGLGYIE